MAKNSQDIRNILDSHADNDLQVMTQSRNSFLESYENGLIEQAIAEQYNNIGGQGHPMSINDCNNLSVYNPDTNKTVDQIMWLAIQDYMRFRLYGNDQQNIYTTSLDRFVDEVENAPSSIKEKLAEKLIIQDFALRDACQSKFNQFLENCPNGKDPQEYAHSMLNESPEYLSLCAFTHFKSTTLLGNELPEYIKDIFLDSSNRSEEKNLANRPSNKMASLVNGEMNQFLQAHNLGSSGQKLSAHELDNFEPTLNKNGFVISKALNDIIEENNNLLKDTGRSSQTMTAMRNSVKAFLDLNHGDPSRVPGYDEKLKAAMDAVAAYQNTHKGYRFTSSGKERVRIANSLAESLALFKSEQDLKKNPVYNLENYQNTGKVLEYALGSDAKELYDQGIKSKEFSESILKNDPVPNQNYQEEYNKGRMQLQENMPEAILPELNLTLTANEIQEKELVHKTGLKNYAQARYESINCTGFIDTAIKYKDLTPDDKQKFGDRDIPSFLFEFGDDGKTTVINIARANEFIGTDIASNLPNRADAIKKHQAAMVAERLNHFKGIDYDKYLNLSDKELADNFVQINRDCFPLSTMTAAIDLLKKDNPYITDDMVKDATTLVNKYSILTTYLPARMNVIGSEYYSSVNDKELLNLSTKNGMNLAFLNGNDKGIQRFNSSLSNLHNCKAGLFSNLVNTKVAKSLDDSIKFGDVHYFDEKGDQIAESDLLDTIKAGKIYTITEGDPDSLKSFSYGGNNFEFKEEALEKDSLVCEKIKAVSDRNIQKLYSDFVSSEERKTPIRFGDMHNSLCSIAYGINSLNFDKKLQEYGLDPTDNTLSQIHGAIYYGKSLDEIKSIPGSDKHADIIEELYKAGRKDFHNKAYASKLIDKIYSSANYQKVDENLLKKEASDAGINVLSGNKASEATNLSNRALKITQQLAKNNVLAYPISDRSYGLYFHKEGLSDDDCFKISQASFTPEGAKSIIQNITDDVLCEDYSNIGTMDINTYTDNYIHNNYIRIANFDNSYSYKTGFKELFTPLEREEYAVFCKAMADQYNAKEAAFTFSTSNGSKIIDFNSVSVENASLGINSKNQNNKSFWAGIVANAFTLSDVQDMNKAMDCYDNLLESRWTNTLLGKPNISKDEVEFINDCLKSPDPATGRQRLYEYAQSEFIKASDDIESGKNNPEKASYLRSCSSAGKMLLNQMKRDGYEPLPEQKEKLQKACDSLSKVNGDISIVINKGRQLNQRGLEREKAFEAKKLEQERKADQAKKDNFKNKISNNEKRFEKALKENISQGNKQQILDNASQYVYFKKLGLRFDKLTPEAVENAFKEQNINTTVSQLKPTITRYINAIELPNLQTMAENKNFGTEFIKGFNFYAQQNQVKVNPEPAQPEKEKPQPSMVPW